MPPAFLKAHCAKPAPADKASCGAVAEYGFNNHCGVVVPIPTLPPDVAKYAEPDEESAVVLAYGNTDATVEVARYRAAVGVEEETRTPEPLMEASMFVPTLEKVALPSTVRVEVAVIAPPKKLVPDV